MSLESNKTLGGVGAILLAIPFLNLVGIILVLIALKAMSEHYNDEDIFKNALYGFIFGIIGVVAFIAVILMFFIGSFAIAPATTALSGFGIFIAVFVVQYIFSLIAAFFYKKSLDKLAKKSNESMFSTAGLILLIGAFIPLVGEILRLIAWILAAVGFFNIEEEKQEITKNTNSSTLEKKQFCAHCGAKMQPQAKFCQTCGKEQTNN
jgi:uncharacterized membrane protein